MKKETALKICLLVVLLVAFFLTVNSGLTWSYFSDNVTIFGNSFITGSW